MEPQPAWEAAKENIQPLRRGRNIASLTEALQNPEILEEKKRYLLNREPFLHRIAVDGSTNDFNLRFSLYFWVPEVWISNIYPESVLFLDREFEEDLRAYEGEDPLQVWDRWVVHLLPVMI